MKKWIEVGIIIFLSVLGARAAQADFDPVLAKAMPSEVLEQKTNEALQAYNLAFPLNIAEVPFSDQEANDPEYDVSVRASLKRGCQETIFGYYASGKPEQERLQFDVRLDLKSIPAQALQDLNVDIHRYKNGMPMRVYFLAQIVSCEVTCKSRSVTFGEKTVVADKVCRVDIKSKKVGELSTGDY